LPGAPSLPTACGPCSPRAPPRSCCAGAGAAFCYPREQQFWEVMEVRAFGLFLNDLVQRIGGEEGGSAEGVEKLKQLVAACVDSEASSRVDFAAVCEALDGVAAS
jgi:hypothetical protein